jgi:metal-responsive CopG/Arc/MetJ family transcriptional regulator
MWTTTMKTIQMTIDEQLLERVDKATDSLGIPRSAFIGQALELALKNMAISELERQHTEGYERLPVKDDEFDFWEGEQARGES